MNILLKSIRLIDTATRKDDVCDILIVEGDIEKIAKKIAPPKGCVEYDMRGKIAAPGFFDMHVHFREPGNEDAETMQSGISCAADSGYTGVMLMPNTNPPIDNAALVHFLRTRHRAAIVDVQTSGCISKGRKGVELAEIGSMVEAGAIAFTDDGAAVMSSGLMRKAFEYAARFNVPIIQHCEDHALTQGGCVNEGAHAVQAGLPGMPTVAEDIIASRDILLAEYLGNVQYHVAHLSSAGAVELVRAAKKKKMNVSCEVTPHHFSLTDEAILSYNTNAKMNPPLRAKKDMEAVIEGLRDGTIDCIATDHAPHAPQTKDQDMGCSPFGIIGLETAIGLCVTNLIKKKVLSWPQLIEKLSVNPRRVLHLPAVKVKEGERANLTIIDPEIEWVVDKKLLRSKSQNSPFLGMKLKGKALGVINNGLAHLPAK
jgi:dihydroorotase